MRDFSTKHCIDVVVMNSFHLVSVLLLPYSCSFASLEYILFAYSIEKRGRYFSLPKSPEIRRFFVGDSIYIPIQPRNPLHGDFENTKKSGDCSPLWKYQCIFYYYSKLPCKIISLSNNRVHQLFGGMCVRGDDDSSIHLFGYLPELFTRVSEP